jgi:epoxyqueuosine reductase
MASQSRGRPFSADPAQLALKPEVSGNAINGLGESTQRQPSVVYWATDPDTIPHGAMQRWFYGVDPDNRHLKRAREDRAKALSGSLSAVEGSPAQRRPEAWNAAIAELSGEAEFDMWGVARMDPLWIYKDQDVPYQNIIMLGFAHDYEQIVTAPEATAGAEVVRQYARAARAANFIAGWLRKQGWDAEPLTGDDIESYDDSPGNSERLWRTW